MGLPLADQYIRSALPRFVARSKKVTHFDNCKAFFESIYDACNDKVSLELRYTAHQSHEGQKRHLLLPFHFSLKNQVPFNFDEAQKLKSC